MCRFIMVTVLLAGKCAISAPASVDGPNIVQYLQSVYVPTLMDASGIEVAQPGATLVVQADGILANPKIKLAPAYANLFVDGQLKPDNCLKCQIANRRGGARPLQVGEKVYLLKMDVDKDSVVFDVQSCGECDPKSVDPTHQPYRAQVTFKFAKGSLTSADPTKIQSVIEQVFRFPDRSFAPIPEPGQSISPSGGDATRPPSPAPLPPASSIELGEAIDQVCAGFGQPEKIISLGNKTIYLYKDLKVTFIDGKVSDVE